MLKSRKGCYRVTRQKSVELSIKHLKSEMSHRNFTESYDSVRIELSGHKVCTTCNVTTRDVTGRKCVCGGPLKSITEEQIFLKFKERAGKKLNVRFYPSSGFSPQYDSVSKPSLMIPGDPDVIAPTTKTYIATIMNISGYRAGVNQVLGFL